MVFRDTMILGRIVGIKNRKEVITCVILGVGVGVMVGDDFVVDILYLGVVQGGACEMLCANPYVKVADGRIRKLDTVLSESARLASTPFPCGQCLHCRINKARMWTFRLLLENYVSSETIFVTLTYDDNKLPIGRNLVKYDYQNFLKRLRYRIKPRTFRYFGVGEYGDKTNRPHYHIILFNVGVSDSESIEKSWTKGFVYVGEFNKYSARYVTGYVVKKMTRKNDPRLKGKEPEFMTCSLKNGGIGASAALIIADKLKQYGIEDYVDQITFDGRDVYLGRYLTDKVNDVMRNKIANDQKERKFYEYQQELFEKYFDNGNIRFNIISSNRDAREVGEKKHRIYKQRRSL